MKKIFFVSLMLLIFSSIGYSAVTTIDGVITLDFYEDTQFGNNRWILDFKVNDVGGGVESVGFEMLFGNTFMGFDNQYNTPSSEYYVLGEIAGDPAKIYPHITSNSYPYIPTPVDTNFIFYAIPAVEGDLIIGDFGVNLQYWVNSTVYKQEIVILSGPIGLAVPEPSIMLLFIFGAIVLRKIHKKKITKFINILT